MLMAASIISRTLAELLTYYPTLLPTLLIYTLESTQSAKVQHQFSLILNFGVQLKGHISVLGGRPKAPSTQAHTARELGRKRWKRPPAEESRPSARESDSHLQAGQSHYPLANWRFLRPVRDLRTSSPRAYLEGHNETEDFLPLHTRNSNYFDLSFGKYSPFSKPLPVYRIYFS